MTFHPDLLAELQWLSQHCRHLFPSLVSLRDAELAALPGLASGDVRLARPTVAALLAALGLRAPVWQGRPAEEALPMLASLPGAGWGVLTGRTASGDWRFETRQGVAHVDVEALSALGPSGEAAFTVLLPDAREARGGASAVTARSMFRAAFAKGWPLFAVAAVAALAANVLALGASLYSMQVYDRVIPTQGVSTLVVLTVGVLVAGLLELVIKLLRARVLEEAMTRIDLSVSQAIFERVMRIRMDQFPRSVGSLAAQIRSYESIRSFLATASMYVAADAPFAVLFLVVIAAVGGLEMAAVPLVFAMLALALGLFHRRRIARHAERGASAANRKFGLLVETVENAECLKAYGGRSRQAAGWRALNVASIEEEASVRHRSEHAGYLAAFLQQASYVAVVALGAYLASTSGRLTMGALIACSILSGRVLAPVAALPGLLMQWAQARVALHNLERVFALELDNHEVTRPLSPQRLRGAYELTDVRFTYAGRPETLVLPGLSIRAGEKVAILGPTGAGKTTLLKILAGLYRVQSGRALLDGLDLHQIDRDVLSERVGFLPQQARLFAGTLRENLLLGLPARTDDELLAACRRTGVSEIIARHPQGLDLPVVEGGECLSGGQRQLVAFTRLLLARPDVWLLDEPTAWMDEQTEARCAGALREQVAPEQTLVLITHQPALLGLVDRIVILGERGILLDGSKADVARRLQQALETAAAGAARGAGEALALPAQKEI